MFFLPPPIGFTFCIPHPQLVSSLDICSSHRVRGSSLPLEYDLERFILSVSHTHPSWTTHTPGCQWYGVRCEGSGKWATSLLWNSVGVSGSLHWSWLPSTVQQLQLSGNCLYGVLGISHFPETMCNADLSQNRFSGDVCLAELPPDTQTIDFSKNLLGGELALESLPSQITTLSVNFNQFVGELILIHLPTSLLIMDFSFNDFIGTVDVSVINDNVLLLNLRENRFSAIQPTQHEAFIFFLPQQDELQ